MTATRPSQGVPLRKPLTTVLATPLAIGVAALAAGCGGSGDAGTTTGGAADGSSTRAAASEPIRPPWNCTETVEIDPLGPDLTLDIEYINKSSRSFVLRARQPKDCAPWGSNNNPGQVNATGVIAPGESQLVKLSCNGWTDRTGTSQVTPLPITINVLGKNPLQRTITDPKIVLFRVVNGNGMYERRNVFLTEARGTSCTGTRPIDAPDPPKLVGTFDCGDLFSRLEPGKHARLTITDAAG